MMHDFGMLEFSCRDAARLASFWSEILGIPVDDGANEAYAQISPPSPLPKWLVIQREPSGGSRSLLVAISSKDLAESTRIAVQAGATDLGEKEQDGFRWTELSDPEGNAFTFDMPPPC